MWNQHGVPHKGWTCIGIDDVGDGIDADERPDYFEVCEMCGQEGVRYLHIMEHPDYNDHLRVGYRCAEKMEDDYINPLRREKDMKNRMNRKKSFMRQEWRLNRNGNFVLRYKGYNITIMKSRYKNGEFGVIFANDGVWSYNGQPINSLDMAKALAFEMFDDYSRQ